MPGRLPREVLFCLSIWFGVSAVFFALASVPAFSPPWLVPATPPRFAVIQFWWPWMAGLFILVSLILIVPSTWEWQRRRVRSLREISVSHRDLFLLLAAATLLRLTLVMRGGQYFDWDEVRYGGSGTWMFAYVSTGHLGGALDLLLRAPDHPAFRIVSLVPAFFHVVSAWPTGLPITEMRYPTGEWLPAFLLSFASVASIGLTYAIAIRAGASRRESFLAAFLMFASSSMLIYAQHFFPYDAALALFLFALWLGMKHAVRTRRSFGVGLLCGFAFLTYEGYWMMAALVAAIHVSRKPLSLSAAAIRAVVFAAGALVFPALLVIAGRLSGRPFLQTFERFSRSAVNGDFSEGWSLPWNYLWSVEHVQLAVYLVGIVLFLAHRLRHREAKYGFTWLAAAAAMYCGLGVGSNVLHRFVVYDRLVRQMLPFMCLTAAAGFCSRLASRARTYTLYGLITLLFAVNVVPLMTQRYPRDIAREMVRRYGAANVRLDTVVRHSNDATVPIFLPLQREEPDEPANARRYVLLNAKDIWVPEGASESAPPPAGKVLFEARHPRQLESMQYHGYRPEERAFLRSVDLSIKLIDTQD